MPQTGVVDDETYKCIFPVDYKVTVVSPNGGEIWDRGQIQTIKWSVTYPIELKTNNAKIMPPHWSKASIDLFKGYVCRAEACPAYVPESVFVKHLATVNLFAGSYSWKISSDIPNSSDYVIRITVGEGIIPMSLYEKGKETIAPDIWPSPKTSWDESDSPFSVTGSQTPPNEDLKELLNILEEMSRLLTRAIQVLQGIISK